MMHISNQGSLAGMQRCSIRQASQSNCVGSQPRVVRGSELEGKIKIQQGPQVWAALTTDILFITPPMCQQSIH